MLRIAVCCRNFSFRPSEFLGIESSIAAVDFDLACSHRLQIFDDKRAVDGIVNLAKCVSVALGFAGPEIFDNSEDGESDTLTDEDFEMLAEKIENFRGAQNGENL